MRTFLSAIVAVAVAASSGLALANRALPSTKYATPRAGALKVAAYVMDRDAAYRNEFNPRGGKDLKVAAMLSTSATMRRYNVVSRTSSPNGPDVEVKITMKRSGGKWKATSAGKVKINYAE